MNDYEECAWCGGICDQPRPYPNRRGEVFCSVNHRTASNRALKRFMQLDRENAIFFPEQKTRNVLDG